jgi:hypothetical protein
LSIVSLSHSRDERRQPPAIITSSTSRHIRTRTDTALLVVNQVALLAVGGGLAGA